MVDATLDVGVSRQQCKNWRQAKNWHGGGGETGWPTGRTIGSFLPNTRAHGGVEPISRAFIGQWDDNDVISNQWALRESPVFPCPFFLLLVYHPQAFGCLSLIPPPLAASRHHPEHHPQRRLLSFSFSHLHCWNISFLVCAAYCLLNSSGFKKPRSSSSRHRMARFCEAAETSTIESTQDVSRTWASVVGTRKTKRCCCCCCRRCWGAAVTLHLASLNVEPGILDDAAGLCDFFQIRSVCGGWVAGRSVGRSVGRSGAKVQRDGNDGYGRWEIAAVHLREAAARGFSC